MSQAELIRHVAHAHPDVCTPPDVPPYPTPFAFPYIPPPPYAQLSSVFVNQATPSSQQGMHQIAGEAGAPVVSTAIAPSAAKPGVKLEGAAPMLSKSEIRGGGQAGAFICDICDVRCDTQEQLDCHLVGQKHRKRAENHSAFQQLALSFPRHGISEQGPGVWVCSLCRVTLDAPNAVRQHLDSVKHRRASAHKEVSSSPSSVASPSHSAPATSASTLTAMQSAAQQLSAPPGFSGSESNAAAPIPQRSTQLQPLISSPVKGARPAIAKPIRPGSANLSQAATIAAATAGGFQCNTCGVSCNSLNSFNAHMASVRHARRVVASASPLSQGSATGSAMGSALKSVTLPPSASAEGVGGTNKNLKAATSISSPTSSPKHRPDITFRCDVCEVDVCGRLNFEIHTQGKNHLKRVKLRAGTASSSPNSNTNNNNGDKAGLLNQHAKELGSDEDIFKGNTPTHISGGLMPGETSSLSPFDPIAPVRIGNKAIKTPIGSQLTKTGGGSANEKAKNLSNAAFSVGNPGER